MQTKIHIYFLQILCLLCIYSFSQRSDSIEYFNEGTRIILDPDTVYAGLLNGNASRDQVIKNVWLTKETFGGLPYDILSVDDIIGGQRIIKVFIYAERKLFSFNVDEPGEPLSIELSSYGSQSPLKFRKAPLRVSQSRENHLVYNYDKHELYCLTQDLRIKIIDPYEFEIIDEIVSINDFSYIYWALLKYDTYTHQLFLGLCNESNSEAELTCYSTEDYSINYQISGLDDLNDFTFNPVDNLLYLSCDFLIQMRNTSDGSLYDEITMPNLMGIFVNAFNPPNLNKVFCLPQSSEISSNNVVYFIGTSLTPHYLSLAKGNFGCGIYNAPTDKIYLGYSAVTLTQTPSGYISFRATDNGGLIDHELEETDIILDMVNVESAVFMGTKNNIYSMYNGTTYPAYTLNAPDSYFFRLTSSFLYQPIVYATNLMNQSYEVAFAPYPHYNVSWEDPSQISGVAYNGIYNHFDRKLYFFNGFDVGHHFLYKYDPISDEIQKIDVFFKITEVVLDEDNNILYFSYNPLETSANNVIKRYDVESDTWIEPDIVFPDGHKMCNKLFFNNNLLYCLVSYEESLSNFIPVMLIYDVESSLTVPVASIEIPGITPSNHLYLANFTTDNDHRVFVSVKKGMTSIGKVISIDEEFNIMSTATNIDGPDKLIYDDLNDRVIVQHTEGDPDILYDWVSIIDFNSSPPVIQEFTPREGYEILDMELDPVSNLLYFDYVDPLSNGDIDIYNTNGSFIHTAQIAYRPFKLKYNPVNGFMYAYVPVNYSDEKKEQIWTIDPSNFEVSSLDLGQNEGRWRNAYYLADLILDDEANKLYSVNAHGNIKVVQCHIDQIPIPDVYNWISFPRLENNTSFDSDDALNYRIRPPIFTNKVGRMDLYVVTADPTPTPHEFNIRKVGGQVLWEENPQGHLDDVDSHKGYILDVAWKDPSRKLELTGTMLDPGYVYNEKFYSGFENWAGYFLTNAQSPFDAIAPEFLDNITWMAGQNWYCHKEANPGTKSSSYSWRCACEQERLEIKYGEMIKIYPSADIENFHWQSAGQPPNEDPKAATEYYDYTEQAAYIPFLIEIDTTDLPLEIGAFAGDSCIGATTVDEGDTLVLIRGFTEGYEGDPVSFELYYGTQKRSPGKIHDYLVSTPDAPQRQRREIILGEQQHWYEISFKDIAGNDTEQPVSWMRCSPNPFSNSCMIDYFLPEGGAVRIEVTDMYGKCVYTLEDGVKGSGEYRTGFNPRETGLKNGVYFIRLAAGNVLQTEKVVYIH